LQVQRRYRVSRKTLPLQRCKTQDDAESTSISYAGRRRVLGRLPNVYPGIWSRRIMIVNLHTNLNYTAKVFLHSRYYYHFLPACPRITQHLTLIVGHLKTSFDLHSPTMNILTTIPTSSSHPITHSATLHSILRTNHTNLAQAISL